MVIKPFVLSCEPVEQSKSGEQDFSAGLFIYATVQLCTTIFLCYEMHTINLRFRLTVLEPFWQTGDSLNEKNRIRHASF